MTRSYKLAFLSLLIAGTMCSCEDTGTEENKETPKDTIVTPPDNKGNGDSSKTQGNNQNGGVQLTLTTQDRINLAYFNNTIIGKSYHDLKQLFPDLKGVRPEDKNDALAAQGYTETSVDITILEKPAKLKFNFHNDAVYKYSFLMNEPDQKKAEHIFNGLITHYSEQFGPALPVQVEEDNHYFRSFTWPSNKQEVNITYDMNEGTIVWGMGVRVAQ